MRAFLTSVQAVSQAITEKNLAQAAQYAHQAGMAAEQNVPGALMRKIPLDMKRLGFDTGKKFDKIAAIVQETGGAAAARRQLDELILNCIARHASYRLPEAPE